MALPNGVAAVAEALEAAGAATIDAKGTSPRDPLGEQIEQIAHHYDGLAPIYGWFTEGFDLADLREARALLEQQSTARPAAPPRAAAP